jgi:hypothetical protein
MSKYHIDTEITEEDGFVWRFTGIYGDPHTDGKVNTWRLMCTLKHQNNNPWLCAGDFNEILHIREKEGGCHGNKSIWIGLKKHSKTVSYETLASREMFLLGEITVMMLASISVKDWIWLWLHMLGVTSSRLIK